MGTIIGEIRIAISTPLKGKFARVNPIAANVPSAVASKVANTAMITLFTIARCHWIEIGDSPKISPYHRSENPSIGYVKKGTELNPRGMIAMIGAIRKKKMSPQITRRA